MKLNIEYRSVESLIPHPRNSRTHSEKQINKIANSIVQYGFNEPIAINLESIIIAGHARLQAAKRVGMTEVPTVQLGHLSKAQQKAYLIAHNRLALDSGWDNAILKDDFEELLASGIDLDSTGFEAIEIEGIKNIDATLLAPSLALEEGERTPVISRPGDVWLLDSHRLICGDAVSECDTLIKQWQKTTKKNAVLELNGLTYKDLSDGKRSNRNNGGNDSTG